MSESKFKKLDNVPVITVGNLPLDAKEALAKTLGVESHIVEHGDYHNSTVRQTVENVLGSAEEADSAKDH